MIEQIIAAAYKRKEPSVPTDRVLNYKDQTLWDSYGKYDDIYDIEIGRRHNDILARFEGQVDVNSSGFYTNFGRFVDRKEAYFIALDACQIKDGETIHTDMLFSEDLW